MVPLHDQRHDSIPLFLGFAGLDQLLAEGGDLGGYLVGQLGFLKKCDYHVNLLGRLF